MLLSARYWVYFLPILCLTGFSEAKEEPKKIADGVILQQDLFNHGMKEGVTCYRIPALVTAPNGDLIAAMDERGGDGGDLGDNKDINIVVRRSTDAGTTWSAIETVFDGPYGVAASDPSMLTDRNTGALFLFYNYMDHNTAPGVYRLYVIKSMDNGISWGKPEEITSQITSPEWQKDFKFITSGNGTQTRSGVLLNTLVNLQRGLYVFGSNDDGKSWFRVDKALTPGDESRVIELADGAWMINSRIKGGGMRYLHTTRDQGKAWQSRPEPALIDPACNAGLVRYTCTTDGYDKNRLLFSNIKTTRERRNLVVRISYDEGATWSEGKVIYAGKAAYSCLAILKNGDIGLLFEKDDYTENIFVRFSLEWLTDGKDRYTPARQGG